MANVNAKWTALTISGEGLEAAEGGVLHLNTPSRSPRGISSGIVDGVTAVTADGPKMRPGAERWSRSMGHAAEPTTASLKFA